MLNAAGHVSQSQDAVLAYAGTSTAGQWFIPSMNELNELCKYAMGQTTGVLTASCSSSGTLKTGTLNDLGGFMADDYYHSSSEYDDPSDTWPTIRALYSYRQFFPFFSQNTSSKTDQKYIRPIRAF